MNFLADSGFGALIKRGLFFFEERPRLCFWLLVLAAMLFLKLPGYIDIEPRGIHFMRQTDNLSFMMGYYQFDVPFLQPRVYNLLGEEGRAVSEFPIVFYAASWLARLFGASPWNLRILYYLMAVLSLWALFRMNFLLQHGTFWSLVGAFLPLSSVVFYYHTVGMISDAAALCSSLLGCLGLVRFYMFGGKRYLFSSTLFFAVAALIKITFLIIPIALWGSFLLFFPSMDIQGAWNKKQWLNYVFSIVIIPGLMAGVWVYYVVWYNTESGNWYFLTQAKPIWKMNWQDIKQTWNYMTAYWSASYYHPTLWTVWLLIFFINGFLYRKGKGIWFRLHWLLFFGSLGVLLLFFRQFGDHDYYFILFYPYFSFLLLTFIHNLRHGFPRIYRSSIVRIFFIAIVFSAYKHAGDKVWSRLRAPDSNADPVRELEGFHVTLDSLQIPKEASFIVMGETTHNGSLYFLRRQGFILHTNETAQLNIMENLRSAHKYRYALSLRGHDFANKVQEWKMELILEREGLRLYRIPEF